MKQAREERKRKKEEERKVLIPVLMEVALVSY